MEANPVPVPSPVSAPPAAPHVRMLPLSAVPGYPAFLGTHSEEEGVLLANALEDIGSLRALERFTPEHRADLVKGLRADLAAWDAPAAALEAAALLEGSNAYAVVTGQQAGIGGGPLYTLYKAVGAVRAARELAGRHPEHRFVPVFWIEGDDHDFDEVRALTLLDRSGAPVRLEYDDGDERPLHVGDRITSIAGLGTLLDEVRAALPATEFGEAAVELLSRAYGHGEAATLAAGFARCLYAMLGDTPLVVMSSRNAALKRLAADVLAQEAADPAVLFAALEQRTGRMAAADLPVPIAPRRGALFITHDGERRSLEIDGGEYQIKGTTERMSFAEAAARARLTPELFSPKVALRPLVQDAILPTAIYLGGPSELAYLLQIRDAYAAFGLSRPAVGPRPFVLLEEPKVRRALESAGMDLATLLAEKFDAAALLVDEQQQAALEAARDTALADVESAGRALEAITAAIDPTLGKSLGAATAAARKAYEDLAKRLAAALRKKEQTEIDRLNAARTFVMPAGAMQERTLNALSILGRVGIDRFRAALDAVELAPGALQVVDV